MAGKWTSFCFLLAAGVLLLAPSADAVIIFGAVIPHGDFVSCDG